VRERRAQARVALTPQQTGGSTASETNLIDARLNRLKLEGTPRVKREKRQYAPPLSPIPAAADFSDFMIPMMGEGVDYGSLAQKMMDDLFGGEGGGGGRHEEEGGEGERGGQREARDRERRVERGDAVEVEGGEANVGVIGGGSADKHPEPESNPIPDLGIAFPTEGMLWALREEREDSDSDNEEGGERRGGG
jgi:cytokinesis protein